ncbi:hypothetical protein V1282_003815 [Nitrobacteraceae bacterium AZCC 2146]
MGRRTPIGIDYPRARHGALAACSWDQRHVPCRPTAIYCFIAVVVVVPDRKGCPAPYQAERGASVVEGLVTRFGDNNGDRLAGVRTIGASRSANSGGTGVGVREAAAARILTPMPPIFFAISCACTRRRPSSCAASTNRFTSSLALIEPGRSVSTFCRIAASDLVSSPWSRRALPSVIQTKTAAQIC